MKDPTLTSEKTRFLQKRGYDFDFTIDSSDDSNRLGSNKFSLVINKFGCHKYVSDKFIKVFEKSINLLFELETEKTGNTVH